MAENERPPEAKNARLTWCTVMFNEMWTRSCSVAVVEPGKSRREFMHRVGKRVLLQVREIACNGGISLF